MNCIGLMAELEPESEGLVSIHDLVGKLTPREIQSVLDHLRQGVEVFDVVETVMDPLEPGEVVVGGSTLCSDGHWVWRKDLAYFVEKYAVGLDRDFLNSVVCGSANVQSRDNILQKGQLALEAYAAATGCVWT